MRRLYGSKKSKIRMGWDGPDWEQCAVSELDSAMNDFVDTVPPHRTSLPFQHIFGVQLSMQCGGILRTRPRAHSSTNPPYSI
jgi:hypothetical protein